jgi:cytochrome c-type biogenesis protein CcmH/NrfG
MNRKADAIEMWKRAVSLDGSDVNALFNLTINLVEAGRRDEARPFGLRFIEAAPPAMRADVETIRRAIQ